MNDPHRRFAVSLFILFFLGIFAVSLETMGETESNTTGTTQPTIDPRLACQEAGGSWDGSMCIFPSTSSSGEPANTKEPPIIQLSHGGILSGTVDIRISVAKAERVGLLLVDSINGNEHTLGEAERAPANDSEWVYAWQTDKTPDGVFRLYAIIKNSYGMYRGGGIEVYVVNREQLEPAPPPLSPIPPQTESTIQQTPRQLIEPPEAKSVDTPTPVIQDREELYRRREAIKEAVEQDIENLSRAIKALSERRPEYVTADSDKDGISDYDEKLIYQTSLSSADTDRDGKSDTEELLEGQNPLDPNPSPLPFEDPHGMGTLKPDLFSVISISFIETAPLHTGMAPQKKIALAGTGPPNALVTLYIYSIPIIVTVRTDGNGEWNYVFDRELEDGQHILYVTVADSGGKIVAKSSPVSFVKEVRAISIVGTSATKVLSDEKPNLFYDRLQVLLASLIGASILGIFLIILGIRHRNVR